MQSCDLDLLKSNLLGDGITQHKHHGVEVVGLDLQWAPKLSLKFSVFDNCVLGYFLYTNTTLLSPPPVLPMSNFFKKLFIFSFARILHIDFRKGRGKVMM